MCVFDIIRSNRASSSTSAEGTYICLKRSLSPSSRLLPVLFAQHKTHFTRHLHTGTPKLPALYGNELLLHHPAQSVMPPTSQSTRFHSHTNTTRSQKLLLGCRIPMNGSIFCADSTIFTMDRAHHQAQTLLLLLLASCIPEKPACVSPRKLPEQQYRLGRLVQLWKSNVVDAHSTRNLVPKNTLLSPFCTSCCTSVRPVLASYSIQS